MPAKTLSDYLIQPSSVHKRSKYVLFPIVRHETWKLYKDLQEIDWTAEEISMTTDIKEWDVKLNEREQHFIKMVLGFFAGSDGLVQANLVERLLNNDFIGDEQEIKAFYTFQNYNELVHSETYSMLIDTLISDSKEKDELFNGIENFPCIQKKANWAEKWINENKFMLNIDGKEQEIEIDFPINIAAFSLIEGVFFSGSFCALFWLKKRGLMPGLTFSNELISRDEKKHTDFAAHIFVDLLLPELKPSEAIIHAMAHEAVEIEKEFITDAIPVAMIGMNAVLMNQYIEFVTDRLIISLGYSPIWNHNECPFEFMDLISLRQKQNFFEGREGGYSKSTTKKADGGTLNEDNYDDDVEI